MKTHEVQQAHSPNANHLRSIGIGKDDGFYCVTSYCKFERRENAIPHNITPRKQRKVFFISYWGYTAIISLTVPAPTQFLITNTCLQVLQWSDNQSCDPVSCFFKIEVGRWRPCVGVMKLPCNGQVNISKEHTNWTNWAHRGREHPLRYSAFAHKRTQTHTVSQASATGKEFLWRLSAVARLPPTSQITAARQSHHDEWAVIGTENCSLVASEVWSRDSISPKWNQSSVLSQFFL